MDERISQLCDNNDSWESVLYELLNRNRDEFYHALFNQVNQLSITKESMKKDLDRIYVYRNLLSQLTQLEGELREYHVIKEFLKGICEDAEWALNYKSEYNPYIKDIVKSLSMLLGEQDISGHLNEKNEKELDRDRLNYLKQIGGREYINAVFEKSLKDVLLEEEPKIDPIVKDMTKHLHDGDKDFPRNTTYDELILDSVNKLLKEYKSNRGNSEEDHNLSEDTPSSKLLDQATDLILKLEKRE